MSCLMPFFQVRCTTMNPFDQQKPIEGIKKILIVGSGKGGVGKSTVSANLALALSKKGKKVGLLDADLYGPSVPRLFGCLNQRPELSDNKKILPLSRYGIKLMSIGFLTDENAAVIWRGPMLFKAMDQFFRDVDWGELDYLIIDLPPGTGDIALTVAQKIPVDGAITVCTPQNLALIDAKKAIDMFEKTKTKHLGLVENMAYFKPNEDSEPIQLFPKGDLDTYIEAKGIQKLVQIPFQPKIGLSAEVGIPVVHSDPESEEAKAFITLADRIL